MEYYKYKFKDICIEKGFIRGPFGSSLKKSLFVPKGNDTYKVYEQCVPLEQDKNSGHYYISGDYFRQSLSRFEVRHNDFLVSCSGVNYGAIYHLTEPFEKGIINQALLIIRIDNTIVDYNYFKYLFKAILSRIITTGTGDSTIPNFPSIDVIKDIDVFLPNIDAQKRIGKLLNDIDSKIIANNSINDNLQHQLKLIYDYWFTQFDFPDKNGKPYRSSGGDMVWNEKLKKDIPKGWSVSTLAALISQSKNGDWGKDIPQSKEDIKVNCFRGADFNTITDDYHITAPIRYISSKHEDRLLTDGDLLIEISGGSSSQSTGRIGYINSKFLERNGGKMDCSNFCKAFSLKKYIYQYWLYHTWVKLYDAGIMFNYEGKTTGIKNLMFDELITSIKVPVPPDGILEEYQTLCSGYFNAIQERLIESAELSSLRDWLLPMLMNGQATISD